ncbi:N-acetylmuramoyl-L-alanine amidase family protein, partial [[Clostridium] scindens]
MLRNLKRSIIAGCLSFLMAFSVLPVQNIVAADIEEGMQDDNIAEEETDSLPNQIPEEDISQTYEENFQEENLLPEDKEESIETSKTEITPELQYVYVEKPVVNIPDSQEIVVSLMNDVIPTEALLYYEKEETGEVVETLASRIEGSAIIFKMDYGDDSQKGIYHLIKVVIKTAVSETEMDFATLGINCKYGVDQKCETTPDAVVEDKEDSQTVTSDNEATYITATDEGELVENSTFEKIITDGDKKTRDIGNANFLSGEKANSNCVVVLDPGHGGYDSGAVGNGAKEKDLTLKIAKYCKEELEQYHGVTVYLTRDTDRAVSGTTDDATELNARVEFAKARNADIFVSIHLNSIGNGSANGAEVYYPNGNYSSSIGNEGKTLAQNIQNELVALGLKNRGIKIRNSANGSTYPDGSLQDYYSIIWRSKRAGFPGVIVEHAFIDNVNDYNKYLSTDEKLKSLGQADAKGIAQSFGLSKGEWKSDSIGWWFQYADGTYPIQCWSYIGGAWYYFDARGYRQTGWLSLGGTRYYLEKDGKMATGWA